MITTLDRAKFLFDEFCLWRSRIFTAYRWVACDDNANRCVREIRQLGYSVCWSDNPVCDGYYYALVNTLDDNIRDENIVLKDVELGYDLSKDPEHGARIK